MDDLTSKEDFAASSGVMPVGELNQNVRKLLEHHIAPLWVSGEISNLTIAASGHLYCSLKDRSGQIRAVMFRHHLQRTEFEPREGMQVEALGQVTLYEPRGDYQLNMTAMRVAGLGALYAEFAQLKAKLSAEGLFEPARKRALPTWPRAVGVVTSLKAAALRDVLTTLKRRMPTLPVVIYPSPVQGETAAEQLCAAVQAAEARAEVEVLLICRGGGSLEDLWSFNDETLVRTLAACSIPIVSGVGHETDFTLCDFVADVRAPTPTAAAELVSPDAQRLRQQLALQTQQLHRQMGRYLERHTQRLDEYARRVVPPRDRIKHHKTVLHRQFQRLQRALNVTIQHIEYRLTAYADRLHSVSPDVVLSRGYALVVRDNGQLVRDPAVLKHGERVKLRLAHGETGARITHESFEQGELF